MIESIPEARERVGVVAGCRPCAKCGFPLEGQPVEREPHYRLLLIFCPECGAPTPVHEYPVLGSWGRRIGAALVAVWLLVLLGVFAAWVGAQTGLSAGFLETSRRASAEAIGKAHAKWFRASGEAARIEAMTNAPQGFVAPQFTVAVESGDVFSPINDEWWATTDRSSIHPAHWTSSEAPLLLAALALAGFAGGAFFATAMPGARGPRRLIVPAIAAVFTGGFVALITLDLARRTYFGWYTVPLKGYSASAMQHAAEVIPRGYVLIAIGTAFALACAGALLGRGLARFTARLLVPPAKLHLLEFLWSADGMKISKAAKQQSSK